MRRLIKVTFLSTLAFCIANACKTTNSGQKSAELVDAPHFDVQDIFYDERFPNVVVAKDGTIICSWGRENFRVRRSEDGGETWEPEETIAKPGFQGGGMIVDENSGDILLFVEEGHPVAPFSMYKSKDHGKTWDQEPLHIKPNSLGHIPSMHMNEHGLTIKNGDYQGRLIRPSRYYGGGNDKQFWDDHYTNAIYSDDGGKSWQASEPFPANGTGEAAIEELANGRLYYNSRRHKSTDGMNPRRRYEAWSDNGGKHWTSIRLIDELPDGAQHRDYGLMGGLTKIVIDDQDVLLFSNIDSKEGRHNGHVWASFNDGQTWPVKKQIDEGSFAYSSMIAGRNGTASEGFIYLLYESGEGAKIARFNIAWLISPN